MSPFCLFICACICYCEKKRKQKWHIVENENLVGVVDPQNISEMQFGIPACDSHWSHGFVQTNIVWTAYQKDHFLLLLCWIRLLKPLPDIVLLGTSLFKIFKSYYTREITSSWAQKECSIKKWMLRLMGTILILHFQINFL